MLPRVYQASLAVIVGVVCGAFAQVEPPFHDTSVLIWQAAPVVLSFASRLTTRPSKVAPAWKDPNENVVQASWLLFVPDVAYELSEA